MKKILLPLALMTLAACSSDTGSKGDAMAMADKMMPFSGPDSVAYAQQLWIALGESKLVGDPASNNPPYQGVHPHGAVLSNNTADLSVEGHSGQVIVKKNYAGEGVSVAAVSADPARYLTAITVMFKREVGYDSANQDWFWAKFKPDGTLHVNEKGLKQAGRVALGKTSGCIACHKAAPGGDYIYTN